MQRARSAGAGSAGAGSAGAESVHSRVMGADARSAGAGMRGALRAGAGSVHSRVWWERARRWRACWAGQGGLGKAHQCSPHRRSARAARCSRRLLSAGCVPMCAPRSPPAHRQTCAGRRRCEEGAHSGIRVVCSAGCAVRGMSAAPRRAAAAATARWQWAAMKGAPLTGACSCEAGVREAAASVLGPCMSLGRGAPACQRRQSVRTARCWELAHLGALDDGSATHLLRHTGGRVSARRAAPTPPTAPIPQDRLRHAFGPARAAGAADLERATEARTAQRQPSGTDGCISSDT